MAGESPVAIIYDGFGKPLAVRDGYAYSPNNSGFLIAGYDENNNIHIVKTTSDGYLQLQLNGTINLQPSVDQGSPATLLDAWPIKITDSIKTVGIHSVGGQNALNIKNIENTYDIFNQIIIGQRNNQIEISFFEDVPTNLVNVSTTSTGYAIQVGGHAHFGTGSNANGTSKGESNATVIYRPLHELYASFSVAFTTGVANSNQRIGLFNDTDGFYIGFENTVFGITHRVNSISTFTAQASFSDDLLDGNVNSKFTRNNIPEALDKTTANIYLISFGWLGSGPIKFSILSPDGAWVTFHTIKRPNTDSSVSLATPNLPVRCEVNKSGAGATDVLIQTACWVAGTTSNLEALTDTISANALAILTKSVIFAQKPNGDFVQITANNNGRLLVSNDSVSTTGAAVPTDATMVGGSDGTNLRAIRTASDGTVRIDPIGTTTQPISATSLPLPIGASTEATLSTLLLNNTFTGRINTLGQKAMSDSTPVVLSSDQSAIAVGIIEGAAGSAKKVLYDIGNTEVYIGMAEQGTASSAAAWLIKKLTFTPNGDPISTTWSSTTAIWDNRTSITYQ